MSRITCFWIAVRISLRGGTFPVCWTSIKRKLELDISGVEHVIPGRCGRCSSWPLPNFSVLRGLVSSVLTNLATRYDAYFPWKIRNVKCLFSYKHNTKVFGISTHLLSTAVGCRHPALSRACSLNGKAQRNQLTTLLRSPGLRYDSPV